LHTSRLPGCLEANMRLSSLLLVVAALGFSACTDDTTTTTHTNALTGASCTPDEVTYMDRGQRSGEIPLDCTGETTDIDHPTYCCRFPQAGCDADGCCDSDLVEPGID
jgi:hypothetical protein